MKCRLLFPLHSSFKLTTQKVWLAAFIWLAAIAPTFARTADSVVLRIAIQQNASQVNVGSSVDARVVDGSGQALGKIQGMNGFAAQARNGGVALDRWQASTLRIEPEDPNGVVWIGDRWYRGSVAIVPTGKGLTAINYVDLEHYLFSVLGSEMNGSWPQEALKAQAVAARSYALYERENSRSPLFDLGNTTGWQVYGGVQTESGGTQSAVAATAGQVLTSNNRVINAVFHSSAGGCTDRSEEVWVQALPYLRGTKNQFDEGSPVNVWSKSVSASQLSSFGVGNVRSIVPTKKTSNCGRIKELEIVGEGGRRVRVSGDTFRDRLGLRSTYLTQITPQGVANSTKGNTKSTATGFLINGRGFGHGLGMSQWGAYNMARQNLSYGQILGQYYQSTALSTIEVK
ncbi:SpoIID/LytB domain-containing protein [Myxacorys almedinensis]|uniref:SpoIID/LytB domain-containing protein n=1 Tax=Myxacorys almedinensis A TaxID=2690445 RepID=A0A8J7Z4D8_9CYAN|nr:SpoIID/LytB domain-containing protein [Myxacorys almedinensis]NDJ19554.1 SpoIID/LytB domain-containing protein [Myxacorys almedinensis A]